MECRLAAILAADVVGYSRLMEADEEATLMTLNAYRQVIDGLVTEHRGRVFSSAGDSVIAEFASPVEAVRCAAEVQRELEMRKAELSEDRRMQFRIGVNLGDVIVEADNLLGDGVNVAARLETLADAGGICLSRPIFDQVKKQLDLGYEYLGEQEVKNIAEPVRVYRVLLEAEKAGKVIGERSTQHVLPDKPSIAVLPFVNMSGGPEQDYFADGITEDIITDLSRFPNLFVIARNSSFTYKGKAVRIQDVGRELGVHYVIVGSVRKAGNRVRVTVQLIDSASENHLWAERYDRELTDIFELQDEVTQAIIGALPSRLEAADIERIKRKRPQNLVAYDYVLRSKILHHRGTREANAEALQVLNKAIEVDPEYAPAYAWRACTLRQAVLRGYAEEPDVASAQRVENAQKALALDENDMECLRILCEIHMEQRELDQAKLYHDRAFAMNPNDPRMAAQRGELLTWTGRPAEGAEWVEKAMRLDPLGANSFAHLLGRALRADRRYADAITAYKQVAVPRYQHHAELAACYAELGSDIDAEWQTAETLRLKPDFSIESYLANLSYKEAADREHLRDSLRKAGLPE